MILLSLLVGCKQPPDTLTPPVDTAALAETGDTATEPDLPPNLLVFLIDDVGPERFSMYAMDSVSIATTPVIDAIADRGVVFDRAYSTPLCSSTRAALLTSRLAFRTGIGTAIWPDEDSELPEEERTIAEALQQSERPWTTGAFGKWHLSGLVVPGAATHPNRQGFDHYDGILQNINSYGLWPRTTNGNTSTSTAYHTRELTRASIAWLNTTPEPWFAYVPLSAAHAPWHAPPDNYVYTPVSDDDDWSVQLNAMIETVDISIGLTLASLPADVRQRTIVVIVGDNGTPYQVAEFPADADHAKGSMYEGGVRAPLIIAGPGIQPGRTDALASLMDIWPTLFELAGEPMPTDRELDGISLVPVLSDPTATVRDTLYIDASLNVPQPTDDLRGQTVISATHKLIIEREQVSFHRILPGLHEGPDLLPGPLQPADQTAYDQLYAEYLRMEALSQAEWASP